MRALEIKIIVFNADRYNIPKKCSQKNKLQVHYVSVSAEICIEITYCAIRHHSPHSVANCTLYLLHRIYDHIAPRLCF